MKITGSPPPNYEAIKAALNLGDRPIIFTYGDTIYNVTMWPLPGHLLAHEATHMQQQGDDPAGWWDRYLKNPEFRTEQEVEAYAVQYGYVQKETKDRNALARCVHSLALDLSSPAYGSILTYSMAINRIKKWHTQS